MNLRGISYHTDDIPAGAVAGDMRVIREDLHCTTVMLVGADTTRNTDAARAALAAGLDVWIRPQVPDLPWAELPGRLADAAKAAEGLRKDHPNRVTLLVGTEFSLLNPGLLPGPTLIRMLFVMKAWLRRPLERRLRRRLNELLAATLVTARAHFHGPIGYAAGPWEEVDWTDFDFIGVNLYRIGTGHASYEQRLDHLLATADKSVVITEFGCGAYRGAEVRGSGSFLAVNWFTDPPTLRKGYVRDESIQAAYLGELLELYQSKEGLRGAFVFTFAMPDFPHREDPAHDLDTAGFGIVRYSPGDPPSWEPKEAFHEIARRYRTS